MKQYDDFGRGPLEFNLIPIDIDASGRDTQ